MLLRCIAELVAASYLIGTVAAEVEIALSESLVDIEIYFSSSWPHRLASRCRASLRAFDALWHV